MSGNSMNRVGDMVKSMTEGVAGQLKKSQSTPLGTVERSKGERTRIWNAIMSMDRETSNSLMREMASMAGHKKEGELDECEWCDFLRENVGK